MALTEDVVPICIHKVNIRRKFSFPNSSYFIVPNMVQLPIPTHFPIILPTEYFVEQETWCEREFTRLEQQWGRLRQSAIWRSGEPFLEQVNKKSILLSCLSRTIFENYYINFPHQESFLCSPVLRKSILSVTSFLWLPKIWQSDSYSVTFIKR